MALYGADNSDLVDKVSEANEFFAAGKYADALRTYDIVISMAPEWEELYKVHSNRGATLTALGRQVRAACRRRRRRRLVPHPPP
jgi:hypothetical protein